MVFLDTTVFPPPRLELLDAVVSSWKVGIVSYLTRSSRMLVMVTSTFRVFTGKERERERDEMEGGYSC